MVTNNIKMGWNWDSNKGKYKYKSKKAEKDMASSSTCKMTGFEIQNRDIPGAPNENIVQNHLNIALLNVF